MRRVGTFLVVLGLLLGSTTTLRAGKGGGNGKPGGGGGDAPPDPAIVFPRGDELVVMNGDGSNQSAILRGEHVFHPTWSPDGTQIVFAGTVFGDGIYVIDVDGSNLRKVVDVYAASNPGPTWSPAPAPDGRYKIAYVDSLESSGTPDEVFLVNLDGTGRQQLTTTPGISYWDGITWAPARTLAVNATNLNEWDIVLLDLGLVDGAVAVTGETNVTSDADAPEGLLNGAAYFADVSWGNVEDKLVVTVGVESAAHTDVWVIDLADPSRSFQVTDTPDFFEELGVTWSPDDSRILFYESFWTGKIYVIDEDGTNMQALASEKGVRNKVGRPDWRRTS